TRSTRDWSSDVCSSDLHMVVGAGVGSPWLGQVDPYFGEPWDGVMLGPYPANEWIDMTAEPTEAFTYDEAGSIVSRRPAPVYRCELGRASCRERAEGGGG